MSGCVTGRIVTAPNGVSFNLSCDSYVPSAYASSSVDDFSLEECLEGCSKENFFLCVAVTYNPENRTCAAFDSTENSVQKDDRSTAFGAFSMSPAAASLAPNCPFDDESSQRAANGLRFKIKCSERIPGFDLADPNPTARGYHPLSLTYRTDTLQGCLDKCADAGPGCLAVDWNPNLTFGWENCHIKLNGSEANLRPLEPADVVHAAIADPSFSSDCADGDGRAPAADGADRTYTVTCGRNSSAPDIAAFVEADLDGCIGRCAAYKGGDTECGALAFGWTVDGGFENCHLKGEAGVLQGSTSSSVVVFNATPSDRDNVTTSDGGGNSGSDSSGGGGNRVGVIVGAVVGGVAALLLLAGAVWWWRRSKRRRRTGVGERAELDHEQSKRVQMGPSETYVKRSELEAPPSELGGSPAIQELEAAGRPLEIREREPVTSEK